MLGQFKRLLFICLIIVLGVFSQSGNAQQQRALFEQFKITDEWSEKQQLANQLLATQLSNQQQVTIYSALAELAFERKNYPQALHYYKLLEQHSSFSTLPELHFRAIKMQGVVHYFQGLLQQAVIDYSRALNLAVNLKSPIKQANLLSNIGLAYFNMHNMELALDYYQQAKTLYEKDGSAQDKADILHNIAGIYIRLSRYDSALEIYREVVDVFQQLGDEEGVALSYGNMGVAYTESGQNQLALHYYQRALRYYQSVNDAYQLSVQHTNLANINLKMDELDAALYHAKSAQKFAQQIDNQSLWLASLHVLAKIQLVMGDIDTAKQNLEKSIELAKEYKDELRVKDGLGIQALLSAGAGDYKRAIYLHQQFVDYQRSMTSEEVMKALNVFQLQFKSNQLNQEIKQLKQERSLQELKIEKRSQLTVLLAIVLLLVLLCVVVLYRRAIEKKAKTQLEQKVEQRTQELEYVAQELRAANQVKSQFLANISHEIRTPLTAILGQTDDLLQGLYQPQQLQTELLVIKKHSDHLKDLINDVLDISKIEANRLDLHTSEFDLVVMINDVYAMSSMQAKSKGLTLLLENQLGASYWTKLDLIRVKQILINLLTNAIKFTEVGSVTLHVNTIEQGVCFKVKDTGIGMNTEQIKNIFECFQQGDNTISRRFGGSGLGLSLSQQLAIMMGGYISVESEFGKGSEFIFNVPCKEYTPRLVSPNISTQPPSTQLTGRVLLAEDHPDNRRLISRFLKSMGLEVIAVSNGEQAVEQCLSEFPDIVLLDIQMPVMDGLSAFELLKKCGFNKPIFALTANAMSHEIDNYLAMGFTGYLSKPIEKETFYRTLASHLSEPIMLPLANPDISDLVSSFIASFDDEIKALAQHVKEKNFIELQQDSHRILGAAQIFSLTNVAKAAMNLDKVLLAKDQQPTDVQITELVNQLIEQLSLHLSSITTS
ncbi:tetratricopeptide repeat protein [Pseudoalteromonas haloplanktis]|uniref:histidine kinase n=3 Tax=Pseudoalteromonas TaxID=53246 RepID=A0ABU1BD67_PSEHA|nr:tetratricopeptide repeat protein [Pseudoalteromonas haloplanktis]MDQ9092255.1 tetratricopeptide repeat protein [Pseudoalteromonas haloplanktis]